MLSCRLLENSLAKSNYLSDLLKLTLVNNSFLNEKRTFFVEHVASYCESSDFSNEIHESSLIECGFLGTCILFP